ncbi:unnamed protein product [Sphagnum jensenii]|uniref:Chaperon P13.9 n=1 Tax=Sphagnum jensenii TaxID=128206 RepID=A0ABP0WK63_9BRYO
MTMCKPSCSKANAVTGPCSLLPASSFVAYGCQLLPTTGLNVQPSLLYSTGRPANSAGKGCAKCKNKGAVECEGCKGTGKNKKNGNMFERWKCYDCQGFGLVGCKNCGTGGLTPEQRGER